jgi:hypothetical protein
MILERLVCSPLNQLNLLLDRKYFIVLSRRESFKLFINWICFCNCIFTGRTIKRSITDCIETLLFSL